MSSPRTLWYYRLPGGFYANGPVEGPASEREFRAALRRDLKVSRLPAWTEIWTTTREEIEDIERSNRRMNNQLPSWARGPL